MKKIINGKKYDTETAEELGWNSNDFAPGDINYWEQILYRKRTGEFFLYEYGGPFGEKHITPMTFNGAAKWVENHLDGDDYETIFGKVPEDDTRKIITVSLASSTIEIGERMAAQKNMSLSALLEELILTNQLDKNKAVHTD